MTDDTLLDADRIALPLPPDPLSPVPEEVERELARYRAGGAAEAKAMLTTIAGAGRTATAGHAAMALAGIELDENGLGDSCRRWLKQVAAGEDPWLGPLAAVMLAPDIEPFMSQDSDPLPRGLAAQLTGDVDTARKGFEQAAVVHNDTETGDLASLLLGNLLLQSGEPAAALEPLRYAREMSGGVFAGYAGYLEGHVLIGQDQKNRAGQVLQHAHRESHPARSGSEGLHPWVAVRFGELLAGDTFALDLVYDQMEESGVSEGEVVREPFESALDRKEVSRPALVDVGFHLFPYTAEFGPVHAGLERLKTWSGERYERGRRLVLALHTYVEDSRNEQCSRGLAELREKLDLPRPR
ncbi:tetratricopeptide repeat protein [Saccharopolyspora erythraea]|uniref:tetratricopeptide repeat protein n=1 Tax=Saccharopolyspora erythraea TaxID=1836 RepID=UPI001BA57B5D|nr:tetratricopeptide repeat protein [Saccharopolyspora erythraea]QUH02242.1 tetratricopeptide repeat protein [Saccharopolyspora erythraea]